jgi:hypothetical protein
MACGVPCVATDVGDSAAIVGETGRIVPPRSSEALAEAWRELLELPAAERARLGQAARGRILKHYELTAISARYEELYQDLLEDRPAPFEPPPVHQDLATGASGHAPLNLASCPQEGPPCMRIAR